MRGSVRQKGPDRWQVRVSLGRDPDTGKYRYVQRDVRGGKREAQRFAAKLVTEVEQGEHRQTEQLTVEALLNRWMTHIEALGRSPSTLTRYRSAIEFNIKPRLGSTRLNKLTPVQIDAYYASLTKAGLNPLTVRKSHAILSASCNQAVKWGLLDRNPVLRSTPPGARQREIVPPTVDEVRRLLEACEQTNPELASLIYLAVTTGCRRGELCALRWSDIDLEHAHVVVSRSISDAGGIVAVKDTKTHQARRLALDPSTVEVLRRQRALVEARATEARIALDRDAYVWSQDLAAKVPHRPDRITGVFRTLTHKLDMPHVTFHTLRHFSATALAGQGIGVRTIAGRLGHANPSITLRTYAHFLEAADRDAADAIGSLVAGLARGTDSP
jgi:integrase